VASPHSVASILDEKGDTKCMQLATLRRAQGLHMASQNVPEFYNFLVLAISNQIDVKFAFSFELLNSSLMSDDKEVFMHQSWY
jgi:hypothetical protein